MANPTVSITSTLNGDYFLTINLATSDAVHSGNTFALALSDYDGFPNTDQQSGFPLKTPVDPKNLCVWDLESSNLGNLNAVFYVTVPAVKDLPNQIKWTLVYTDGSSSSDWANVN